jgi:hypothetical protein
MAQAEDRAEWRLRPWAGTIEQLKRAAQLCKAKVAEEVSFPPDYDPDTSKRFDAKKHDQWRSAEEARMVVVKTVEEDGFSRQLTSIADLDDLGPDQLGSVEGIDIDVGGSYSNPSARITASADRGLTLNLVGPDRSWTAGLLHELKTTLRPVGKLRPLPFSALEAYFSAAAFAFSLLVIGLSVYLDSQTDWSTGAKAAVPLAVGAIAAAILVTIGVKLPTLELLAPGDKPAYERWRSRILAALGAVALGIAGSLLAALIGG